MGVWKILSISARVKVILYKLLNLTEGVVGNCTRGAVNFY